MRLRLLAIMTALAFLLAPMALSQSILVWDKDHNLTFQDPEGGGQVDATYGVTKALTANGYTFTKVTTLPADLSPYNILFVIMGSYC